MLEESGMLISDADNSSWMLDLLFVYFVSVSVGDIRSSTLE